MPNKDRRLNKMSIANPKRKPFKIDKKTFYYEGGLTNPKLFRKQLKSGSWSYWKE